MTDEEMQDQTLMDLEQLRTFLIKDNLFNYGLLRKSIILPRLGILMLSDFRREPIGQTQHAAGYVLLGKKMLELDVSYSPYSRKVTVAIGRVVIQVTMDEIQDILSQHPESEEDEEELEEVDEQ